MVSWERASGSPRRHNRRARAPAGRTNLSRSAPPAAQKVGQEDGTGQHLPQPRGHRRPHDPPLQREDEQPVQKDVGRRPGAHPHKGQGGGPVVAHEDGQAIAQQQGDGKGGVVEEVVHRHPLHGGAELRPAAEGHHLGGQAHPHPHEEEGEKHGQGQGGLEGAVGPRPVPPAHGDGHRRGPAHGEHGRRCHHEGDEGHPDVHRPQSGSPHSLAHEDTVYDVVQIGHAQPPDGGDHIAGHGSSLLVHIAASLYAEKKRGETKSVSSHFSHPGDGKSSDKQGQCSTTGGSRQGANFPEHSPAPLCRLRTGGASIYPSWAAIRSARSVR